MNKPIILASRSPRRQELLRQAGIAYEVDPADIEEVMDPAFRSISASWRWPKRRHLRCWLDIQIV